MYHIYAKYRTSVLVIILEMITLYPGIDCPLIVSFETASVDTQVQILTDNFLLALDYCAPFEEKLIKRPPARWMDRNHKK